MIVILKLVYFWYVFEITVNRNIGPQILFKLYNFSTRTKTKLRIEKFKSDTKKKQH